VFGYDKHGYEPGGYGKSAGMGVTSGNIDVFLQVWH